MLIQGESFLGYDKDVDKADTELMESDHPAVYEAMPYYGKSVYGALLGSRKKTT